MKPAPSMSSLTSSSQKITSRNFCSCVIPARYSMSRGQKAASAFPRSGVIRIHQLTIREAAEAAVTTDAPERLMLELLRFRRRRPFLVTDNHDGLTIVERSDDVAASQSLFDALQAASVAVGAQIVSRGTSTINELSGARNTARRASF